MVALKKCSQSLACCLYPPFFSGRKDGSRRATGSKTQSRAEGGGGGEAKKADRSGAEGAGAIGAAAPGGVRASLPPSAWRRRGFLLEHGGGASSARIGVADERGSRGGMDAARGRERASGAMEGVGTQGARRCSEANAQYGVSEGAGRGSGVCEELGGVRRMAMQDE